MATPDLLASRLLRFAPLGAIVAHALLCPYTKVEESFNLQAVHDLLYRGAALGGYDHLEFPGVVPRTFLAPLALAAASAPFAAFARALGLGRGWTQLAARLALGGASSACLGRVGRALDARFGRSVGGLFALLCAAQFHLPFYASRTLPNTFALLCTNVSLGLWLDGAAEPALLALVPAAVCLRAELLLWLAPLGLLCLGQRAVRFCAVLRAGLALGLASLAASLLVDSLFWRRPLWPEGEVLLFNTVQNQSSRWGVSPPLWYFTSALPRALLGAGPLALYGGAVEPRARPLLALPLAFVAAYSLLPHKELRFVIYAVPALNAAAAVGAEHALRLARAPQRTRSCAEPRRARIARWVARLALAALAAGTCAVTAAATLASRANYPGAHALAALHAAAPPAAGGSNSCCSVHIDAAAAMTGVSLFLQDDPRFAYSKREGAARDADFTHLVTARPRVRGFTLLHAQPGFESLQLWPPRLRLAPKIFVHESDHAAAARRRR